jgi:HlyD family secretion protein
VAVTALGRIEPEGEVIKLSAGSSQGGNALIEQLQVRQGDDVQVNQVIAVLDSRARLQAAFDKSLQDVRVAEANLARVKQGVKQGEILAQEAAIARWEEQLRGEATTAEATLAKLRAQLAWEPAAQSAKIRALTAQLNGEQPNYTARLRRLDAQLQNAQREYERYKSLYQQNAIAASRIDEKQLQVETVRQQIEEARSAYNQSTSVTRQQIVEAQANQQRLQATLTQQLREAEATYQKNIASLRQQILEAKANLERLREVRPVDVSQAEAEVARSIAASQQARADLGNAFVRSSIAGKVFKINSRPGEIPNNTKGIIEVAQTDRMHVVAEVYESDINRVRLGQTVAIKSETGAFPQSVRGTVYFIGSTIGKKDVLSSDPAADVDARVVEVKIRIDSADNAIVQNLTNAKVLVNIDINNTGTPSLPTDPASPQ